MSTQVIVALISAAALGVPIVLSYFLNRQGARDLVSSIDLEIEIIRKLRPDSPEVRKLTAHISSGIDKLIITDSRRELANTLVWKVGPFWLIGAGVYGLGKWEQHGIPADIRPTVLVFIWALVAVGFVLVIQTAWEFAKVIYHSGRLWYWKIRHWFGERKLAKLEGEADELEAKAIEVERRSIAMADAAQKAIDMSMSQKGEIIAKRGQEAWDELEQTLNELDHLIKTRPERPKRPRRRDEAPETTTEPEPGREPATTPPPDTESDPPPDQPGSPKQ